MFAQVITVMAKTMKVMPRAVVLIVGDIICLNVEMLFSNWLGRNYPIEKRIGEERITGLEYHSSPISFIWLCNKQR